ncbi:C45 family autoproteolytic acyltransferase/hydrolase [Pseudobacillus sp. 179-B 2D1 NHS]|uniref:C45 family autoproteolytic acyltransferase/hydolase n=1 Tax=Pseudobacillus sp. 179-B 2D1 NHS TaxID=3374292 RepID=UPI0038792E9F
MIKKLRLKGSYKEIGKGHGSEGKREVLKSLETYETLFYDYSQIRWNEAREMALKHAEAISKYDDDLIKEMEGVAAGAGVDFEDILALNTRSEIALSGKYSQFSDGCTAIGVMPPMSSGVIIGQNWDWKSAQSESLLYVEIEQTGKPNIKMMTEGGIIGKIGCNSAGLGVCLNALLTDKKSNRIPIHLGLRSVLNSFTYSEAILRIDEGLMASAANFLIGSAENQNGIVMNVEVSPAGIDIEESVDGYVVHTNHICSSFIKSHIADKNEYIETDSLVRMNRARQLIRGQAAQNKKAGEASFKQWLSDQYNFPDSINHFINDKLPPHRRMETIFSIIMNLSGKKMLVCVGKPSQGPYVEM